MEPPTIPSLVALGVYLVADTYGGGGVASNVAVAIEDVTGLDGVETSVQASGSLSTAALRLANVSVMGAISTL